MKTSLIIPVFNNINLTIKCLRSVVNGKENFNTEIIVVDNGSTDNTQNIIKNAHIEIKILSNTTNLGFAKACNQGAHCATGDMLIFLNNDTEVTTGWISSLTACAARKNNIGIVGCKLLYPDSTVQHAGVAFSSVKVHHIYRNFSPFHPAVNKTREFQAVTAACMLVPRKLFLSLGGFDESFINGFEDLDFCFRARSKGFKVMYTPESVVIHHESKTPGRHDHHAHNARLFASRWLPSVDHDLDKIYAEDGLLRHAEYGKKIGGKWLIDANANHFWEKARALTKQGDYLEAEKHFAQALSFNPYDVRRLTIAEELADLYLRWGRFSDADSCLDSIIQVRPSKSLLEKKARITTLTQNPPRDTLLV